MELEGEGLDIDMRSVGDGSNAILLLGKKKSDSKHMRKVLDKRKLKKEPTLSKSKQRKLKKIQEEKEKKALLSKSIHILEKCKIQDDVYSLLRSSGTIGQAESMREKRCRAMQFSRAGLEVPEDALPFKKKKSRQNATRGNEISARSDSGQNRFENESGDYAPLPLKLIEDNRPKPSCLSSPDVDDDPNVEAPIRGDTTYEDTGLCMREDVEVPPRSSDKLKSVRLQDPDIDGPKVDIQGTTSILANNTEERPTSTRTVVHVSRPDEVEKKRLDLPIVMMEQEIMEAINEHPTVIICGETGCGKTTQVPQFLYEAGFGSNLGGSRKGIIGVTQPRRVAVLATAKRVSFELGLRLGREVGFQVRHDKKIGIDCSIKFMTDGILLREAQSDFLLKRYSVIILDEAHERSLNTDILVGMLSRIIEVRKKLCLEQKEIMLSGVQINPENVITPLKLVLMSATLRVEDFVSHKKLFCEPPPVIEVPTRQFPVTFHFSKRTDIVDYMGQAYKKVMSIHKRLPAGGILVFVTGQREVEDLCGKLRKASKKLINSGSKGLKDGETENVTEIEDIAEAFDLDDHSSDRQIDRFSSHDEDHVDQLKTSYSSSSGTESELEIASEDEDTNPAILDETGTKADFYKNAVSLSCLKASFSALTGNPSTSECRGDQSLTVTASTEVGTKCTPAFVRKNEVNCNGGLYVLPLYAMLPADAQLRVFEDVPEGQRLIVVATNVAETSLTIPGIKYVVDTGREKVKNYNPTNGMATFEVQWISKASAAQRSGRAGRTGPGHCYRLYSSAVFNNIFTEFSSAEISKIPVDGIVLLLKSIGIDKVANFPFPTPPETISLVEAECCLKALEALDSQERLTPLGKAMAQYPMSPRHSRMLLTVIQIMKKQQGYDRANLVLGYTVAAAAALSFPNPFIMHFEGSHGKTIDQDREDKVESLAHKSDVAHEKTLDHEEKLRKKKLRETARVARAKFCNPSSDALTIAYALQLFELAKNPVDFCNENSLHFKTMDEMSKLRKQLLQLVCHQNAVVGMQEFSWSGGSIHDVECAWRIPSDKHPLRMNEEEILGQAICAGWADRVAKRTRNASASSDKERKSNAVRYQACAVNETVFVHRGSAVSQSAPEFLVYSELLDAKRPYMHGVTSVKCSWLVKYASSLCTFSAPLTDPRPYYEPVNDQVLCWVSPTFGPHLWQLPLHSIPIKNGTLRVSTFACALLEGQVLPCLRSAQKFLAAPPTSILKPEASCQRRVGDILSRLRTRSRIIDSRAMLREAWNENPHILKSEIRQWFQERFHDQFEQFWVQMHDEVLLEGPELFPKRAKKEQKKAK
ncbi:putative pre-mRNA-splicing factor ATP-dependent RNA helicase [Acorus gramineus]|uniref:RNA helicase n=1 Tax=Acorus gramineus TaxID=55184 RepID=A0AAV9BYA7_ACOGR|nr:putative pre-mRNA-splicing factor ATP-dependent RNA helicase [Acorus gramineus]